VCIWQAVDHCLSSGSKRPLKAKWISLVSDETGVAADFSETDSMTADAVGRVVRFFQAHLVAM
jgi:hypothetical protein